MVIPIPKSLLTNEFSAHKGIYDENNTESDWIEIYNNMIQLRILSGLFN